MPARRFPPPWTAEVTPNCFIVRDANGQQLAYVYYESERGRRSAAKLLSKDEARRIAANTAKLPETTAQVRADYVCQENQHSPEYVTSRDEQWGAALQRL